MGHSREDRERRGRGRARTQSPGARDRILDAAYDLFSRNGIQAAGIDGVICRSGVPRQTLFRHFASKQDLVLAFLERREDQWTRRWLEDAVRRRASDPTAQLLTIFDVFDEWFVAPTSRDARSST